MKKITRLYNLFVVPTNTVESGSGCKSKGKVYESPIYVRFNYF